MEAYATNDGHIFWGEDAHEIVSKMRRSEFVAEHGSNRTYIRSVTHRLREMLFDLQGSAEGVAGLENAEEGEFLVRLMGMGLLIEITEDFECPRARTFCNARHSSCSDETSDGYCWMKKQQENMEDEPDVD